MALFPSPIPAPEGFPTPELLVRARRELAAADSALARVDALTPTFEWRAWERGLPGLLKIVVGQQVSVASAASTWMRIETGLGAINADRVLACDQEQLRALGLSRPKARYFHEIAQAVLDGRVDFTAIDRMDDQEAMARLVAVKGVGLWTAETYLLFCHGRTDLFPAGDVALQEALRWADQAPRRPSRDEAYERAELWRPWRGVAAHLLWRFYGAVKHGEIAYPKPLLD